MAVSNRIDNQSEDYKLGQRIKYWREQRGLSQTELAGIIEIDRAAISRYENGTNGEMGYRTLKKFCEALQVSSDVLMDTSFKNQHYDISALNRWIGEGMNAMMNIQKTFESLQTTGTD